jgi:hypothetical protein
LVDDIVKSSINNGLVEGGQTILGSFPEYINHATSTNSTYFNMPSEAWNTLANGGAEFVWAINRRFLDYTVGAGHSFVVKMGEGKTVGFYLQREIDYLINTKGYVWLDNVPGSTLIPGD